MERRDFLKKSVGTVLTGLLVPAPLALAKGLVQDALSKNGDPTNLPYGLLATSQTEEIDAELRIKGTLPPKLKGALYRNGPGIFERNGYRKRSVLDGDGMVRAYRFENGKVKFSNRFVRTNKFVAEEKKGQFVHASWCTRAPGGALTNLLGLTMSVQGCASVNTIRKGEKLYAFSEGVAPWELDPRTLATLGYSTIGTKNGKSPVFNAHYKVDGKNGDWVHFGVNYGKGAVDLAVFDRDLNLLNSNELKLEWMVYMHDFFVTENYIILHYHPTMIDMISYMLGKKSFTESFVWRPEMGGLLITIDRKTLKPVGKTRIDARFMWHSVNAFEDAEGKLVLDFVGFGNPDHFVGSDAATRQVMRGERGIWISPGEFCRVRYAPQAPSATVEIVAAGDFEFPSVRPEQVCYDYDVAFLTRKGPDEWFWNSISRVDPKTGAERRYHFPDGFYCGEPIYADGFLLTEVLNTKKERTELHILDADRIEQGSVAVAVLPFHLPLSFHGSWDKA